MLRQRGSDADSQAEAAAREMAAGVVGGRRTSSAGARGRGRADGFGPDRDFRKDEGRRWCFCLSLSMLLSLSVWNSGYMGLYFWSHVLTAYKGFSPLKPLTLKDRRTAAFDGTMVASVTMR